MTTSHRGTISCHYAGMKFRLCPVCQHLIDLDHAEAISMDTGQLPNEFDAEAVQRELAVETFRRTIALDLDFVTSVVIARAHGGRARYGSPTDTNPCIEVGFEVVA